MGTRPVRGAAAVLEDDIEQDGTPLLREQLHAFAMAGADTRARSAAPDRRTAAVSQRQAERRRPAPDRSARTGLHATTPTRPRSAGGMGHAALPAFGP